MESPYTKADILDLWDAFSKSPNVRINKVRQMSVDMALQMELLRDGIVVFTLSLNIFNEKRLIDVTPRHTGGEFFYFDLSEKEHEWALSVWNRVNKTYLPVSELKKLL